MSNFKEKQDSFVSEYLRQTGFYQVFRDSFAEVLQNFVDVNLANSIADMYIYEASNPSKNSHGDERHSPRFLGEEDHTYSDRIAHLQPRGNHYDLAKIIDEIIKPEKCEIIADYDINALALAPFDLENFSQPVINGFSIYLPIVNNEDIDENASYYNQSFFGNIFYADDSQEQNYDIDVIREIVEKEKALGTMFRLITGTIKEDIPNTFADSDYYTDNLSYTDSLEG